MTEIHIYGPQSMIKNYPRRILPIVDEVTSYPVQGAEWSKAYRKGLWDGRKRLFRKRTGAFPTGLVPAVREALEGLDEEVQIVDHRFEPVPSKQGFDLHGVTFEYPYDYQLDTCKKMIEQKQGIVKIATNGGKSECACAVTQYLGLQTLFIVTTRELLYQARKRFMTRLQVDETQVGIIGDGNWLPGEWVTIATLDTLESRMNTPECQDLLKSMEVMFIDECVEQYSVISTEKGYKYAKDVEVGDVVITHTDKSPVIRKTMQKKQGVSIFTESGKELICSLDHLVACVRDGEVKYIYAEDITEGDVLLERNYKYNNKGDIDYKAYIAGLFAGDGCWYTNNKVRWVFRKDHDFWCVTVFDIIKAVYTDAIIDIKSNNRGDISLIVDSPQFIEDLLELGFRPFTNKTQSLPLHDNILSYIGGLYDAEGSIDPTTNRLFLQTVCKPLMQAIQVALRDQGVNATLIKCVKNNKKHAVGWRVCVSADDISKFHELCLSLLDRKKLINKKIRKFSRKTKDIHIWNIAAKRKSKPLVVKKVSKLQDPITTVELEVEGDHTFVANGLLTHNCHHVGSDTWYTISTLCRAYYRYGMSGTPLDRTDGADLRLIAATGEKIVDINNKFLVERGVSAQAHVIFDKVTEPVVKKKSRYPTVYKQGVVENPNMLSKIVEWAKVFYEAGLGCLILCEEIQHGRLIDDALWTQTDGVFIPHQFIYGGESSETRQKALDDFASRNLPVLIASTILDEGVDVPTIDALILAGSRKSRIRTMQRLGRGLRGQRLVVVDFANFCHKYLIEHSLQRMEDFRNEECFPIYNSAPDKDLVKKIWEEN